VLRDITRDHTTSCKARVILRDLHKRRGWGGGAKGVPIWTAWGVRLLSWGYWWGPGSLRRGGGGQRGYRSGLLGACTSHLGDIGGDLGLCGGRMCRGRGGRLSCHRWTGCIAVAFRSPTNRRSLRTGCPVGHNSCQVGHCSSPRMN